MKRFLAFSGGVESTTMAILYGKDATPIFTDTGYEHDLMYERIDMVENALKIIHGDEFHIVRIKAKNVQGTGTDTLPEYIKHRLFYPNPNARFCTRLFKIEPMDDFLRGEGECELSIGLNFDEADEREGNYGLCENVKYRYPLVEDGKTRNDCESILIKFGLLPNFPSYMIRGGCKGCFFKRKSEYAAMAVMAPKEANEVADIEEFIQDKRKTYYHIHDQIPNLRKFISNMQSVIPMFPIEEIYRSGIGQGCGVFCHR
jgi:hypothetical protein